MNIYQVIIISVSSRTSWIVDRIYGIHCLGKTKRRNGAYKYAFLKRKIQIFDDMWWYLCISLWNINFNRSSQWRPHCQNEVFWKNGMVDEISLSFRLPARILFCSNCVLTDVFFGGGKIDHLKLLAVSIPHAPFSSLISVDCRSMIYITVIKQTCLCVLFDIRYI